jgi:hypothetical protein
MNALTAFFASLQARLEALSPRERGALALLSALGAIYVAFVAFDWSQSAQDKAFTAHADRVATEQAALGDRGEIYLLALDEEAGKARSYAFTDATIHIARARLLSLMENKARLAGLENLRLTADRAPPPRQGPQTVKATLEATFDQVAYLSFLRELASSEQSLTPTVIDIRDNPEPRLRITLEAPYLSPDRRP